MLESEIKALRGSFPNIVSKKKLAPLPLFNQNKFPSHSPNVSPTKGKTIFASLTPRHEFQASTLASPRQPFLNDFKTINNYGRLCDQPFLEFSSFHSEQVFGAGAVKKKIVLEPLQKKKHKITKLFTLRDSKEFSRSTLEFGKSSLDFGKSSVIKIQDHASANPHITVNQKPREKVKDKNKQKENQAVIKKVYKIGDYEAVVGFYSLEVVLTCGEAETQKTFSLRIGKDKLRQIYKFPHAELTATVLESLIFKDGKLKMKIQKESKQDRYIGDETYPEKKENLSATIDGQTYKATIHYPHLEVSIASLNYTEKVMLKPLFLANLYEENFNNLQDYIQKFTLPREVTKTKEEIHHEELKNMPTIIKKVVKTSDFGGLILFKSLEVHLKNTSEVEPETIMHESTLTPMAQKMLRKKKKDINTALLRLKLDEVVKLLKCTPEEITELVRESIGIEEGEGFVINLDKEKLNNYHERQRGGVEEFPEYGEKFTIRFNRFIYEGFIKFPTLELYIPETNYKDVIQLKPYQLRDLIDEEFTNIEAYLHYFKKPSVQTEQVEKVISHTIPIGDETPRESVQINEETHLEELKNMPTIVKKVVKTLDYGGLMLFKSLEVHIRNTSDFESERAQNSARKKKKDTNTVLLRLKLDELFRLLKCTPEEITELVRDSVGIEEGTGLVVSLDNEKLNGYHARQGGEVEEFPEHGEKFVIELTNSTYEGFIRFPTLELYIPESNYKEVIQLKPYQLRDLMHQEFKNMEAYLRYFKKSAVAQTEQVVISHTIPLGGDDTPREFVQSVEILTTNQTPMANENAATDQVSSIKQQYSINVSSE